jgi:molecular chaperone GrpE
MTSENIDDIAKPESAIDPRGGEAQSAPEAEQNPVERLLAERDEEIAALKDRVLRTVAETENVRRRLEREKSDAAQYGATAFARDMLSIADNLTRAVSALPQDGQATSDALKPVLTGIEMTMKELSNVFQRHGIARIESMGQRLDPNRHQAMMEIENGEVEPGTIVQELQAGYLIKDRLLRPALVGVAKAPAGQPVGSAIDADA